tara:strand:+ start:290 stop:970 length:681 start_codon:yes stop_codon:yes gene_type:complete
MKKIIILFLALSFNFSSAQFSAFFSFQTDSPESVVAVMDNMMSSEVGKKIPARVSLFGISFAGYEKATHMVSFDFPNANALQSFMMGTASTPEFLYFQSLGNKITKPINSILGTPVIMNGDYTKDNVFLFYYIMVDNPALYAKEWSSFTKAYNKNGKIPGSYGLGANISGRDDSSHLVWVGAKDMVSLIDANKEMLSSKAFGEFNEKVKNIRKVSKTMMIFRIKSY